MSKLDMVKVRKALNWLILVLNLLAAERVKPRSVFSDFFSKLLRRDP